MSGQGKYQGRGSYHGGREQASRSGRLSKLNQEKRPTNAASMAEIKFVPHYSGKQQVVTYDTVKDSIINVIQKTYKHGSDIAKALCEDADLADVGSGPPTRKKVSSYNIEYKEALHAHNMHKQTYKENKPKAYALIFSYCNKVTQNHIEESPVFEAEIRNDPLRLLREIKKKMYDPARAKY